MPEGHTIHRIALDHTKILRGKHVAVSSPQGRFAVDATLVDGVRLRRLEAYGKHLFYTGPTGSSATCTSACSAGSVCIATNHRRPRRPCECGWRYRRQRSTSSVRPTAPIGTPDDRDESCGASGRIRCEPDADPQKAFDAIVRRVAPIGQLLLDQKVISGLGNVYRAEALFANASTRDAGEPDHPRDFDGLWATIVTMLERGVADDRIVTLDRDQFDVSTGTARRGDTTYVYHRDLCLPCGAPIQKVDLGGRACYYCPVGQPR